MVPHVRPEQARGGLSVGRAKHEPPGVVFARLADGTWGLLGPAATLSPGASVDVLKRDGSTETKTVGEVVWTGRVRALARIDDDRPPPALLYQRKRI